MNQAKRPIAGRLARRIGESIGRLTTAAPPPPPSSGGMDRALPKRPLWRKLAPFLGAGAALLLIVMWAMSGFHARTYRVPLDHLTIATVSRGPFDNFIAVRGAVAPFITDYLTTENGGIVRKVLVQDGAIVKKGEPLIILANSTLQSQVAQQEAQTASQINALDSTELQLEDVRFKYQSQLLDIDHQIAKLKASLARDKILLDGNAIAPSTYKEEQQEYAYERKLRAATVKSRDTEQKVRNDQLAQLQQALTQLKQNMALAKASLDALTIRAPMAGQLTALDAKIGQSKAGGAVLGQIDSRERFKLTADVDEFYLGRVRLGQQALFSIDGHAYKARVAKIYPQVTSGTFKVDLEFTGVAPTGIYTGQAVDLKIELGGTKSAVMLPNGPFYQDTGGNWVFVVAPNGTHATRRDVHLGLRNPEYVQVLSGLTPGEKVIVSSYEAFAKMDRITFERSGNNS